MIDLLAALALAAEQPKLDPPLAPLGFLLGHCWEGSFPTGERDRHCFEPVYGGRHVRDVHEVTGPKGVYRGETVYSGEGDRATYTYWNSLGGVSRGTMRPAGERLDFGDETYKGPDGREIAISTHWRRVGDDAFEAVSASEGAPSMNRTVRYVRVPDGEVRISESRALDGTHSLVHEIVVPAPVEEVWAAIATAEGWKTWAVPLARTPEPDIIETSYSPDAEPGGPATIRQRILAAVPGRLIAFRTVKAPARFPDFDAFSRTTGLFELEPLGPGRTRVRLTGAGYPDSEAGRRLLGFFRDGNRISLERLRQRFVEGPVDWAKLLAGS